MSDTANSDAILCLDLAADLYCKFSVPVALENRLSGDGEQVVRIALIDVDPSNARTVADEAVEMMVDRFDGIPFEIVVFDLEQRTSEVSRLRAQAALCKWGVE